MKHLTLFLMATSISISTAADDDTRTIFDFSETDTDRDWTAVNDGVMGGLSEGEAEMGEDALKFSGTLSLENNGGFSMIQNQGDYDLSGFSGLRLRVKGDGRTYNARMHTDERYRSGKVAYSGEFSTKDGEWIEVEVPFDSLEQSWRGQELSDYPFDPAEVEMIGFILADKKGGPFRLEVEWVKAY